MDQRQCVNCRIRFIPSRNPQQRYCANPVCQKKRRCKYQKQRLKQDPDYRANQRALECHWHKKHPHYWQKYRKDHPDKTAKNRINQRKRDQRRRQSISFSKKPLLATMYAFDSKNVYLSMHCDVILCGKGVLATIGCYSQVISGLLALPP
jgi:hypothetical protein